MYTDSFINIVIQWVTATTSQVVPNEWYAPTRDIFQARLETFLSRIQKSVGDRAYLLTAIVGEIGNNSFDHNLGQWRDIPGIFFADDINKKVIVLADRGQGVQQTISRVMPKIITDEEALMVAFTQVVSGRSPERRGNGLKFVAQIIKQRGWSLTFQSGNAELTYDKGKLLPVHKLQMRINGCLAIIYY